MAKQIIHHLTTHGKSRTSEYKIWLGMRYRCKNPKSHLYSLYGERGIKVSHDWDCSFENFFSDMGVKPKDTTLDRINNDGDYRKDNCRWATYTEQNRNNRGNVILTFNGKRMCISEWAETLNISHKLIRTRIRRGWSPERALTTPVLRR